MNRLINRALGLEALAGKRVVVLAREWEAHDLLDVVSTIEPSMVARIVRAHGGQRVEFKSGGDIRLVDTRTGGSLRGFVPDLLYVDGDQWSPRLEQDMMPVLATGRTEVVRA